MSAKGNPMIELAKVEVPADVPLRTSVDIDYSKAKKISVQVVKSNFN